MASPQVLTLASVSADGRTLTTVEDILFNHYGYVGGRP